MDYSVSRFKEGLENGHSFISGHSFPSFLFALHIDEGEGQRSGLGFRRRT